MRLLGSVSTSVRGAAGRSELTLAQEARDRAEASAKASAHLAADLSARVADLEEVAAEGRLRAAGTGATIVN